jgi:hypothetical protein
MREWRDILAATLLALAVTAGDAGASIIGDTVHVDRLMPDASTIAFNLGNAIVGPGIEYPGNAAVAQSIDFAANAVTITENAAIGVQTLFFAEAFNGFGLSDVTHPFTAVSIDPLTNLAGLNASDLGLANGEIFLNLSGLTIFATGNPSHQPATNLVLDVSTAAIPEPAALALFACGLGLISLGLSCSRRRY